MLYHNSGKRIALTTALTVFLALSALIIPVAFAEETDPWTDIPEDQVIDWGEMWGTVIQFEYAYDPEIGNQAQTIKWDFGDGSERSSDWNPQHTYTEHGTYTIVQHVTNTYDGYAEDWGYYRLTIMGQPFVEIVMPNDADPMEKVYATKGTVPIIPDTTPVYTGHTFDGYYADAEHTVPYNWTTPIDTPVTVYAAFKDGALIPDVPEDSEEPVTDDYVWNGTILLMSSIGIIMILVAIYTRNPFVAIVTLALITLSILGILDIIDIPEIFDNFDEIFGRQNL